jgi:predicted CopG family antitoxin
VPSKGYKVITIPEDLYEKIKDIAEKTNRSIPNTVEYLFKEYKELEVISEPFSKEEIKKLKQKARERI